MPTFGLETRALRDTDVEFKSFLTRIDPGPAVDSREDAGCCQAVCLHFRYHQKQPSGRREWRTGSFTGSELPDAPGGRDKCGILCVGREAFRSPRGVSCSLCFMRLLSPSHAVRACVPLSDVSPRPGTGQQEGARFAAPRWTSRLCLLQSSVAGVAGSRGINVAANVLPWRGKAQLTLEQHRFKAHGFFPQ